jgi:hypothetical protein|tara:strand:- start:583 stop:1011 length:429 start_codon:yes stop_codon:yes gene_type:complete
MLPNVVLSIIQEYTDELDALTDLPSISVVTRLMDKCDRFVIKVLGSALNMPHGEVRRLRFRLQMRGDFVFYFHMSYSQRFYVLNLLQTSIKKNWAISCMTWIFLEKQPHLINVPRYRKIFRDGLFCRLMEYLITETDNGFAI